MQVWQCWCYNDRKFETRFKYKGLLPKFWKFHRWSIYTSTFICACFVKIHRVVFEKIGQRFYRMSFSQSECTIWIMWLLRHINMFSCVSTHIAECFVERDWITTNKKEVHLIQTLLWYFFAMRRNLVSHATKKVLDILLYSA